MSMSVPESPWAYGPADPRLHVLEARVARPVQYAPPAREGGLSNPQVKLLAIVTVVALVAGVLFTFAGGGGASPEDGELVASMPVGPQGGTIPFGDGGKVEVPAGAVDKPQTIEVRRTIVRERVRVQPSDGGAPVLVPPGALVVYFFGPVGVRFRLPITIVFPPPPAGRRVVPFISLGQQIQVLTGPQVLGGGRTVAIQTQTLGLRGVSQTQVLAR